MGSDDDPRGWRRLEWLLERDSFAVLAVIQLGLQGTDSHARVIADCALRVFAAREVSGFHGARAEATLQRALMGWTGEDEPRQV